MVSVDGESGWVEGRSSRKGARVGRAFESGGSSDETDEGKAGLAKGLREDGEQLV